MGLWDDIKDFAGDAKDAVVDVFDGDDGGQRAPKMEKLFRPEYSGNAFQTFNPAYSARKDEFEKPLWMQGADQQSPYSSWDNDFLKRMFEQQDKLADEGKLGEQWDRKDATGVVSWDHTTKGGKQVRFGDVFDKGKLVGNLYDEAEEGDKKRKPGLPSMVADADLMMSQLLLEPEELAQIGQDRDPAARLRSTIDEIHQRYNVEIPQSQQAAEQQENVDATQKEIQEAGGGKGDDILAAGLGAVGGGLLAGGAAAAATGVGAVPGAIAAGAGALLGGAAAWLNRDDISEQAASEFEKFKLGWNDDQGTAVGDVASGVKGLAGLAGRGLAPFSNLTRGLLDDDRGNGVGALQEEDRPSWAKPLDVVASIADAGFTFASPAGMLAYGTQMGATSAAGVAELTAGGGYRWDAQAGEFRNVYKDTEGDFSAANAAGAWASTGIDIAQTAMVKGIADKIRSVDRRVIGKEIDGKIVRTVEEKAGRTFYLDDAGDVISSKVNFAQAFIPSEGVQMLAAGGAARAAAARSGRAGQTTKDDLYKASLSLVRAEAPIKAALVNAVGEGTEEAAQEALDTWSFDHKVSPQQLAESYAYGAAAGLGMGFAANYRTRTRDAAELKASVEAGYISVHGKLPEGWDEMYGKMTPEERRQHVTNILNPQELAAFKAQEGERAALQSSTTPSNQLVTSLQNQAMQSEIERTNRKTGQSGDSINRAVGNPIFTASQRNPDGSTKFLSGTHADDAATQGPRSQLFYYEQRLAALPKLLATIARQRDEAASEVARLQQAGETDVAAQQQKVDDLQDEHDLWAGTDKFLPQIIKAVRAQVELLADESRPMVDRMQALDALNRQLDEWYRSEDDSLALAAAAVRLRSPYDNAASFHVAAPAVSLAAIKDDVETGFGADWASLDVTTADFDGDRLTNSVGLAIGRQAFRNARAGVSWLTTGLNQKSGEQESMYKVASVATDKAAAITAHEVHRKVWMPKARAVPVKWLNEYVKTMVTRYAGTPDAQLVQYLHKELKTRLLQRKNVEPIEELMKFFATDEVFAPMMAAYGADHRTNEPSVAVGVYRSHMDGMLTDINKVAASLVPANERKGAQKGTAEDLYPNASGQHRTVNQQSAATLLGTFFQYLGSPDLLRIGQVIRLNHQDYTDRGVAEADTEPLLDLAGAHMRALSQGHIRSAQEVGEYGSEFDIPSRVREMAIEIVATDQRLRTQRELEAAAFQLLLKDVGDVQFTGKDKIKTRHNVTVAQALTMSYIQQLRVDAALPISRDPQLQLKLEMLERAANDARGDDAGKRPNGEMLILKDALGAFNVANVLTIGAVAGWESTALNITGSVEQNIRLLRAQTPSVRADLKRAMLAKQDLKEKQPLYETLVHFMFEVAQTEQSRTEERNNQGSVAAMGLREEVITAMTETNTPRTTKAVLDLLQEPGGQRIIEALTSGTSVAAFVSNSDGTYTLRDWVLQFFVEPDPGRAEVILWEQRAISTLTLADARRALKESQRTAEDEDSETDSDEADNDGYLRIDDSLARLMHHLRQHSPAQLRRLQSEIATSKDRESLEKWINSQEEFYFHIPVLMYENSSAQFDPDLANGGWNTATTGYGAAIREVSTAATSFKNRVSQKKKNRVANVHTADRVLRQRRANPDDPQFSRLEAELTRAVEVSVKGMHPNDTLDAMMRAYQIATDMHTKGGEHEAFEAYGAAQVQEAVQTNFADPFVDAANLLLEVRDISDLRSRPELVFRTGKFVDEYGRTVQMPNLWGSDGKVSLELVLEAIANDGSTGLADILTEAMLPRQYAYDRDTGLTAVTTAGPRTLEDLVTRRYEKSFEAVDGKFTASADAALGVEVTAAAQAVNYNHVAVFERAVMAIATPRVLSSRGWSRDRVAFELQTVRRQLAKALREAGSVLNKAPGLYERTVETAVRDLVDAQLEAQRGRAAELGTSRSLGVAVRSQTREMLDTMVDSLIRQHELASKQEHIEAIREDLVALRDHFSDRKPLDGAQLDELYQRISGRTEMPTPMVELLNSIRSGNPLAHLHAMFGKGEVITEAQRKAIAGYLNTPGMRIDVDNRVRHNEDATKALRDFRTPGRSWTNMDWATLSRVVLSHVVQSESVEGWSTTDQMVVFMDDRTLDPTFSLVLEHLFDKTNPMVAAMAGISKDRPEAPSADKLHRSMMDLFPADGSIRWDQSISAHAMALDALVPPISAGKAAGLKGNGGKVMDAMAMAARTYVPDKPPSEDLLETMVLERTREGFVIRGSSVPNTDISIIEGAIGTAAVGGQPVALAGMAGLPVDQAYQAITLNRLQQVVPVVGQTIEVRYFHPMRRPAGASQMNNIYFDGVIAHDSSQVSEYVSLIAEMYNQPNGILQLGTRSVLDAVKAKLPAVVRVHVSPQGEWDLAAAPDPTAYLNAMAQTLAWDVDFGFKGLGPAWGKATLKYVTMRHLVRYSDGTFSSVHDYMAAQRENPAEVAARQPELVSLSERTANTLYGEVGTQGLQGYPMEGRISAGSQAFSWKALTPRQKQVLKELGRKPVKLRDTSAARRSVLSAPEAVKTTNELKNPDLADLVALVTTRDRMLAARSKYLKASPSIDLPGMREMQRTVANRLMLDDNSSTFVRSDEFESLLARMGHEESEFSSPNSYHVLVTAQGSLDQGVVTPTNFREIGDKLGPLTFGDTAVLDLERLADFETGTVLQILRVLIDSKVTVSLRGVGSREASELTGAVVRMLRSTHDYESLIEAHDTFAPRESVHFYQLERAYESRLMEQGFRTATSRLLTLAPTGRTLAGFGQLNESLSYMLDEGSRYITQSALIKQYSTQLATPIHMVEVPGIAEMLRGMRDELLALEPDQLSAGLTHEQAVDDLLARARDGKLPLTSEGLELRKGMFEVYVIRGREAGDKPKLYLHRYGSKFAKSSDLDTFRRGSGQLLVSKKDETEPSQTVVEGRVVGHRFHGPSDLQLVVDAEHYWSGDKIIPLFGGNKTISTELPEGLDWVRGSIAGPLRAQYLVSDADAIKKLSLLDMVGTFTQAAEVLGFDNMPIFFKGFYGMDYDPAAHETEMDTLRTILGSVRKDPIARPGRIQRLVETLARGANSKDSAILALVAPEYLSQVQAALSGESSSVERRVLLAGIAYLSLPNASLADIERAGGFATQAAHEVGRGSLRMPTTFTSIYDLADDARALAQKQFNARLDEGWSMNPDYTLRRWYNNGENFQDFRFGFTVQSVTGESVGTNADPTKPQGTSVHNQQLSEQAVVGGMFATDYSAEGFSTFMDVATSWDTVVPIREVPGTASSSRNSKSRPWLQLGINRISYRERVREKLTHYFETIDLSNQGEIHEVDRERLKEGIRDIAVTLFNDSTGRSDHHVHHLLRLALGRPTPSPGAKKEEHEASRISLSSLEKGIEGIKGNIARGYSPLRRGAVSLVPLEIRNKIIEANVGRKGGWQMRMYSKGKRVEIDPTKSADDYTAALFDHALGDPEANNIAGFNNVLDAVMHQYQEASADLVALPVSLDLALDFDLIRRDMLAEDEIGKLRKNKTSFAEFMRENPDLAKTSLISSTETLLTPQFMHDIARSATMAQQLGIVDPKMLDNDAPSAEMLRHVEQRFAAYNKARDTPFPTRRSLKGRRDAGLDTMDNENNSHSLFRNLLSLHAAKALLNPALALGALVDSRMRLVISDIRHMVTGEGTGFTGRRVASVVESQGPVGVLARGFGWRAMLTKEQTEKFNRLLNTTATTSVMSEAINEDLADYADYLRQQGTWKWLYKANKLAANMQDLARGTKGKSLRRNYMHAAISYAVANNLASAQTLIDGLGTRGDFIKQNYLDAHNAGIATMNDLRGVQETMISSALTAGVRATTHTGNAGVNAVAQMTLAMPLMFQRYAANLFLTLTGARALDQLAAHALRGRMKPGFWQQVSAKAAGGTAESEPVINMDDVIGSLDAMDAVINMGITHSLLFTGGLVMGGLGLGGEDEEEKRRRRAAAAQGAVWLSDPRDIENDFRNAQALFLDEIPGLNQIFANDAGRAVVSPHWILKPLTSPLLGMERFFATGDIRQLKWGFEDAITSMPLLNMVTFNKAVTMSEELSHAAQDAAASGNLGASDSAGFLTHLVSYYEHALFESSFLNALYVGFDDYDRDPYVMPLRDSDGDLQRDAEGNVRANSDQHLSSKGLDGRGLALQTYADEDGNLQQGYWKESGATTSSRILAESRLSYGIISSLVTGLQGKGMNTRYNMAVKTRKVEKPELSEKEQKAAALAVYTSKLQGNLPKPDEATAEQVIALSFIDEYGKELLTDKGARAVFNGILAGAVTPNSAALQGISIDYETRKAIQEDFLDELTIEGMSRGLSESSAKYRAKRVMFGEGGLPGMSELLFDKTVIPYSTEQEFQQLNTTYIMGPDGNMWATGFERSRLLGALGLAPLQGMHTSADTHTGMDGRMNVAGLGSGNTGLRSLRPINDSLDSPTDAEIGDAITRAIEDLDMRDYGGGYGNGYRRFGGYGGGGGGGGYAQRPVTNYDEPPRWTNLNFNPIVLRTPYANDVYGARMDTIRTDFSGIRRERISSERGRLTQWQ